MQYIAWPIAVVVIVVAGMLIFRAPVETFINKLKNVKAPGGVALATTEYQEALSPAANADLSIVAAQATIDSLTGVIQNFAAEAADAQMRVQISEMEKARLIEQATEDVSRLRRETFVWWCRYLTVFFVPSSKLTLQLIQILHRDGVSEADLESLMSAYVDNPTERAAILTALSATVMMTSENGIYKSTPLAAVFLHYVNNNGELNLNLLPQ
jgi:hypothetical protein